MKFNGNRFLTMALKALLVASLMTGCAAVNPYNADFQCPALKNGKCQGVSESYEEALGKQDGSVKTINAGETLDCPDCSGDSPSQKESGSQETESQSLVSVHKSAAKSALKSAEDAYREAQYEKLSRLVREPETPLKSSPDVLRVWLLPYEGEDGSLFMERFVYLVVDQPKWTLGQPLNP